MLLALGADGLGPALRQDGYSLRPPSQFHLTRMDLFHGTRVGAIGFSAEPTGFLSAALTDADPDDSSMLLISVGDSTFPSGPTARDALATAVVRHFQDDLGIRFSLLTAASIQDRVEVEDLLSHFCTPTL